jgi:ATP-dependent helicase/nuclease subunit A
VKIEAGAGTGKTTRIVELLLERLLNEGVPPQNVLALTFTVKAAAEMRERLRRWLTLLMRREPIRELPGFAPNLARGPQVLEAVDQMEIGTIHSFAGHLLRLHPVEAGVTPDFEEDPGEAFDALFAECWERHRAEASLWERVLEVAEPADLEALARALCRFGMPLEAVEPAAYATRLAQLVTEARDARAKLKGKNQQTRAMEAAAAVFGGATDAEALEDGSGPIVRAARAVLDVNDALIGDVLAALRPFVHAFRREYLRRGFLSFDGMIHCALDLLRTHEEIRGRLQKRFRSILVDEFQDTDPLQGELILMLAEDDPSKVTIVGDPKQSIYLFRGADLEAYAEFKARLPGPEERRSVNYRSCPRIIECVNAVFPDFPPLTAHRTDAPGSVELMEFEGNADEAREAEGEAIASMIRREVDAGIWRYGQYAVLLRALPDAHRYLDAFRRHGIEFAIEGGRYFFEAPEVLDFVNLLRAIVEPADAAAVAGVMRSALGGLTDRELLEGRRDERLLATLRDLHELSGRARIDVWVGEIFRRLPVLETAAATYRGDQAVANVLRMLDLALAEPSRTPEAFLRECAARIREAEPEEEGALADEQLDVVRILSIHKAKGLEFPVVILPDLHRGSGGRRAAPAARWHRRFGAGYRLGAAITKARFLIDEHFERQEEEERRRILYVAMTRARDRLVLTGARGKSGSYMQMIRERVDLTPRAIEPVKPVPRARRAKDAFDPVALEALWRAREGVEAAPALVTPSSLVEKRVHLSDRDDPERRDAAAAVGTVCHAVLERIDFAAPSLAPIEELARRYAPRGRAADVAREARAILEGFVRSAAFAEIARSRILARELPFVRREGNGVMTGQIDLVIDRGAGPEVIDYKTDRALDPAAYVPQGAVYARALGGALNQSASRSVQGVAPFWLADLRGGRLVRI